MISNFHQNEGLMKDRNQDPLILSYSSMDPHLIWLRFKEKRERRERERMIHHTRGTDLEKYII